MGHLTVLTSGHGGIRFLTGLIEVRPEEEIHVVANVGNDCELWGLYCCPDIDLVLHSASGQFDPYRGEGANGVTYQCFDTIRKLGMPGSLRICDRDLATQLVRSDLMRHGASLADATLQLADRFGLGVRLMPPTNERVSTTIHTSGGSLGGIEYRTHGANGSQVTGVSYEGAESAHAADGVVASILEADRVLIAPADPILGIGPMLAVADLRNALARTRAGVVAISPLIGTLPARGESHPLLDSMGDVRAPVVRLAERLRGLIDTLVIHTTDLPVLEAVRATGVDAWADNILIHNQDDARRLAGRLAFLERAVARKR
jgi:LPPG:FO 2-phospho-L-lactate transferase